MVHIDPQMLVGKTDRHLASDGLCAGLLHTEAVDAFAGLVESARQAGFDLRIASGFRDFDSQLAIWNAKARGERPVYDDRDCPVDLTELSDLQKIHAIMRFSALPGGSRHHWGTDLDVYDAAAVDGDYTVQLNLAECDRGGPFFELHDWLDQFLPGTDFYRPYGFGGEGVAREPWHVSYRPLSDNCMKRCSSALILDALQGVEIELYHAIRANMDALYERYVKSS